MTAQSTKTKVNQPLPDRYYGAFRTLMFAKQIYADQSLSTPVKIVLTELLHSYNSKDDRCDYVTERDVAKKHQLGLETVRLAIKAGIARGYLTTFQAGKYERNQYTWKWDRDPAEFPDTPRAPRRHSDATKQKQREATRKRAPVLEGSTDLYLREVQTVLEGSTGPVLEGSGQETIRVLPDERIQNESTHGERGEFSKVGPKDLAKDQHSTNPHTAAGTHADAGRPLADPQTTVGQPVVPSSHWPAAGKKSSPATGASFSGAHKPQEAAGAAIPSGPVPAAPARSRKPKRKKDELSPAPKTYSEKTKAYCLSLLDAFPQEWTTKHHKAGDDPAARQKSDWAEALDKLDRLLKAGIDPNYLVIRAGMYADEMATKNKEASLSRPQKTGCI